MPEPLDPLELEKLKLQRESLKQQRQLMDMMYQDQMQKAKSSRNTRGNVQGLGCLLIIIGLFIWPLMIVGIPVLLIGLCWPVSEKPRRPY